MRSMPVEFLTDDEVAAYGRYAGAPSQADLERVFFLHDQDRTLVDLRAARLSHRPSPMKQGLAERMTGSLVGGYWNLPAAGHQGLPGDGQGDHAASLRTGARALVIRLIWPATCRCMPSSTAARIERSVRGPSVA